MTAWIVLGLGLLGCVATLIVSQRSKKAPMPSPRTLTESLTARGGGKGVEWFLSQRPARVLEDDHPARSLLGERIDVDGEPLLPSSLLLLDRALETLSSSTHADSPWTNSRVATAWSDDLNAAGGALSELEAFGTLLDVFPTCLPVPVAATPTPDFSVPDSISVEIYRPRENVPNRLNVERDLASQNGAVKIAPSYPITGSDGLAREYPTSKVVDRIVNTKRTSKQTLGVPGILYVDLRHEWNVDSNLLQPFLTVASKGEYWIGTFGAWHAFYGAQKRDTMLKERATLRFLSDHDVHAQMREGLFRSAPHWAGAIIAASDGVVIYQNPWSTNPLSTDALRGLLRIYGVRAELSWYQANDDLAGRVEQTLARMEWSFRPIS